MRSKDGSSLMRLFQLASSVSTIAVAGPSAEFRVRVEMR
jgi:hypothetical protein